jgi:hypothetical protein
MRLKSLVVLMMVGVMLSACAREQRSGRAGAHGEATLAGQVRMSGTAQSSPESVSVSFGGTGMSTVLGTRMARSDRQQGTSTGS